MQTCPKCGALIVPQLVRCRQCKTYLHGTGAEGWIFEHLLPEGAARSPGTALIVLLIIAYYLLMVALTAPDAPASAIGFSSFSLQQLGATHGVSMLRGQWWRAVTSIFGHHDLVHVSLNLASLIAVGPLVERIFDKKKMLLIYLLTGIGSMLISFVWYVFVQHSLIFVSAGASGAVCGLIGAAWVGAHRMGVDGRDVAAGMKRWSIYMVAWGFMVPGINNAAHFGGFLIGAALARFTPLGLVKSVQIQKALSVAMLAGLALVIASTGLMLKNLHGFPAALPSDARPRAILGFVYSQGARGSDADQVLIARHCFELAQIEPPSAEAVHACELNARANDQSADSLRLLADLEARSGASEDAERLRWIAGRMRRGALGKILRPGDAVQPLDILARRSFK